MLRPPFLGKNQDFLRRGCQVYLRGVAHGAPLVASTLGFAGAQTPVLFSLCEMKMMLSATWAVVKTIKRGHLLHLVPGMGRHSANMNSYFFLAYLPAYSYPGL